MEISKGLAECLKLTPKLYDANGTLYLSISEVGLGNACVQYEKPKALADWFNATYSLGTDFGSGTEHAGTAKLAAHLRWLRGELGQAGPQVPKEPPKPADVGGWTFDAAEAKARARNGVQPSGVVADYGDFVSRKRMFDERGNPLNHEGVDDELVEVLYETGVWGKLYPGEPPATMGTASFAQYVGLTLQMWLDQMQLVVGGGRGPSGGDDPSRGPGVA